MAKPIRTAIALGGLMLISCGGGSSEPAALNEEGTFGDVAFSGRLLSQPDIFQAGQATVTSMTGVFTSLRIRYPMPANSNSVIFFSPEGRNLLMVDGDGARPQSLKPTPSSFRFASLDYNQSNNRLYVGSGKWIDLYSGANGSFTSAQDCMSVSVSPSGNRIAFVRNLAMSYSIYSANADGSNPIVVKSNSAGVYEWGNDENLIIPEFGSLKLYKYDGTTLSTTSNPNTITSIARAPDGSSCAMIIYPQGATEPLVRVYELDQSGWPSYAPGAGWKEIVTPVEPRAIAFSSDGRSLIVLGADQSLVAYSDGGQTQTLYNSVAFSYVPATLAVTPPVAERKIVGPLAAATGEAAGFLMSQLGDKVACAVAIDVDTRSSLTLQPQDLGPNPANVVYRVQADNINKLKFSTNALHRMLSALPASGACNGALISLDLSTGLVNAVLPYLETRSKPTLAMRGEEILAEGEFLDVIDGQGNRLGQASRVGLLGGAVQVHR